MAKHNFAGFVLVIILFTSACNFNWSYDNQSKWKKKFAECAGQMQSPVNIDTSAVVSDSSLTPLFIDYYPVDTFSVKLDNQWLSLSSLEGSVSIPGDAFWGRHFFLAKVIFHVPSEHTVNGKHFPAEVQFVNIDTAKQYVVISVFLVPGKKNETLQLILDNAEKNKDILVAQSFDINGLVPYDVHYWHYIGSLSFPPCSGKVQWFVMKRPVEVSQEQLKKLQTLLQGNIRNIQPVGDRKITEF